jgi:TRAP-type mannitol/chloroaromatic compound transport system substrate-binding protein
MNRARCRCRQLFGALPFGMETPQFAAWMYFGGGDALLKEAFKPHNVYPIFCGSISPEAAGWFRKEIKTPDDLKGLKFRAAGLGGKIYQKLGASVTMLPGGELVPGAGKGRARRHRVFAAHGGRPARLRQGRQELLPAGLAPAFHQPVPLREHGGLGKLKPQTQAQIETTCTAGVTMALAKAEALQGEMLAKFKKEGVTLRQFNKTMLDAFAKAVQGSPG